MKCALTINYFRPIFFYLILINIFIHSQSFAAVSDGFDYPVGSHGSYGLCPSTTGATSCYWLAQEFKGTHLGEDWNRGSSYTDFGDPIYSASKGEIVYAKENVDGWGKVLIIRSTLPDGQQVECLYAHLGEMPKRSGSVDRGEKIGTIGDGDGRYISHLHFEIRYLNCRAWGSPGPGYSSDKTGWTNPSNFIAENRHFEGSNDKPDLVVKELYLSNHRTVFLPGEAFKIAIRIKNIGKGDVKDDVTIRYYRSKGAKIDSSGIRVSLGTDNIRDYNMKAGDSQWEYKDTNAPNEPGLYNITVRADDDKKIDESNEDNNWFDPPLTFTVVNLPPPNGSIVNQIDDPAVYIFYNGKKWWASSWEILNALGFEKSQLITHPAGALNGYSNGLGVVSENLLGQLGSSIFLFQNGKWCYLPDWAYMDCRGGRHPENVIPITQALMDMYGQGPDITPCYIPVPPIANFTASPVSGVFPLTVNFTDGSTGDITNRLWDFGDGQSSDQINPLHQYQQEGVYSVTLTIQGPAGTDSEVKSSFINVYAPAKANFTAIPTKGKMPLKVQFINISTGTINKYYWDFGDGSFSTEMHPQHIYRKPGKYTVKLIVEGPGGNDIKTTLYFIKVYGRNLQSIYQLLLLH